MWRSLASWSGRLLAVLGVCLLVVFAPSSAWADTATPTPTDTSTPTSTDTATATPSDTSSPTSTSAPTSTATSSSTPVPLSTAVPVGSEADPLFVTLPAPVLAVFYLVGGLVVFLLGAMLVSGWGR